MNTRTHDNILLLTDSYKLSHYKQYPKDTEVVFSYFESRDGAEFPYTQFFGLQYFIKRYLEGNVVTREKIDQAESVARLHLGEFNKEGWEYILEKHRGKLPIRIRAVPEGTNVPTSNVLMTIQNTDPKCFWLTNYLETLLVQVWYGSTVATLSRAVKNIIREGMEKTGADMEGLPFKLHDFGFRGSTSVESAGIGGLAHLTNFLGTDTLAALGTGMEYYGAGVCGFSIPASEHSTITSWGKEHELDAYKNMLEQYPTGLVACVSDSYDIDKACSDLWGKELKDEILNREGVLVVRPDSGEIVSMVENVLQRLWDAFGGTINEKGFKVLDSHVRVIQGDGCTIDTIQRVINMMVEKGWSLDNIAFGMGGGLLQKVDRDTQRFAFKCSAIKRNGVWQDVRKAPKSDMSKASKGGRLTYIQNKWGNLMTIDHQLLESEDTEIMRTVFENGEMIVNGTFDAVKKRADEPISFW